MRFINLLTKKKQLGFIVFITSININDAFDLIFQ